MEVYNLRLRTDFIERVKQIHGFKSDKALADTIGVGFRTLTRVKAHPETITTQIIAGFCVAFGYSPSDVVEVENNRLTSRNSQTA